MAGDLRAFGAAEVACLIADLNNPLEHDAVLKRSWDYNGQVDLALLAYGVYRERDEAEQTSTLLNLLSTNFLSAAHLALKITERFEGQGAAKGGLSIFLQGLDHKLASTRVRVSDIRLGLADTPMTANLPPSPLKVGPDRAAAVILQGLERERQVIYTPGFWRWIMLVVRLIPRRIMNRLDF